MRTSVLILSEPGRPSTVFVLHFEGITVLDLVKKIVDHDGLFLNDQKSDWIPKHRILRVWAS